VFENSFLSLIVGFAVIIIVAGRSKIRETININLPARLAIIDVVFDRITRRSRVFFK